MTASLAGVAPRRRSDGEPDRWAWASSIAMALVFTAGAMAVSLWWFRVVDGEAGWLVGPDIWGITDAGRTIYSGALGWVYHTPYEIYALPLGYVAVAPGVWLADHYNLVEGAPFALPTPSAWLVVGPYTYMLGAVLLHAVRRLAAELGVQRRRWLVQLLAVALVLVPSAYWNHPEDVLALAATVHALRYARTSRFTAAAVAIGVAISCKQWSLVALPFIYLEVPAGQRRRFFVQSLALPAALAGVCLAADFQEAARHLFAPKLVAASADPGHHAPWAGLLGHATSRLSRALELGVAPLVAWRYRSADWATRAVALGVVLMARPVLEPYSFAYYWGPGLLVTVLGMVAVRDRLRTVAWPWPLLLLGWTMPGDASDLLYSAGIAVIAAAWAWSAAGHRGPVLGAEEILKWSASRTDADCASEPRSPIPAGA